MTLHGSLMLGAAGLIVISYAGTKAKNPWIGLGGLLGAAVTAALVLTNTI